jgi:AraC-like DNA-binding protein
MLGIGDYRIIGNIAVSFEFKHSPVVLGSSVSGSIRSTVNYKESQKDVWVFKPGHSFISYSPECKGITKYSTATPIRVVGIYMDRTLFNKIMTDQHDQIPTGMLDIVNGANEKHYYHTLTTTPLVNMAVHEILNCPYRGLLKRMYLESKALELITRKLAQVASPECGLRNPSPLRPADIERIHEARDILISNMQNPTSLFNLARQVGLNETKLKRGFRQVYGTSVFRYLRNHRFEHARHLLGERRMNVSEVAFAIGYSRIDCFISSFKARFGITPGLYSRSSTLIS